MYSVIQPIEVLDEDNNMVSTWNVLTTDLKSLDEGNAWITDNVVSDMVEHTWVAKTSDILRLNNVELQNLVLGFLGTEPDPNDNHEPVDVGC